MDWVSIFLPSLSSLLSGVLLWKFKALRAEGEAERIERAKKHEALVDGVVAMLRDRLIDVMDYYLVMGWVPHHKAEAVNKMYLAYHGLGGNDIVTQTYRQFTALPHAAPQKGDDANV